MLAILRKPLLVTLLGVLLVSQSRQAEAQPPYRELDVPPSMVGETREAAANRRKYFTQANGVLGGRESLADRRDSFISYFRLYYIPKMTRISNLGELSDDRKSLLLMLQRARSAEAHDLLVQILSSDMARIVQENFHPAVRYNAMLIIGMLSGQ